jgi:precorrin-2 dehydrogenase
MRLYPLALKVAGRRCVVVGGGRIAGRKVASLLDCDAAVTVVSPEFSPELEALAGQSAITAVRRGFEPRDLDGARIAIAATDDPSVNQAVLDAGKARGVLVNVVDVPDLCDFYVPASVTRGDLQITISTGGACPALAKHLRKEISKQFGSEYEAYLLLAERLRLAVLERVSEPARRKEALNAFLTSQALALLTQGRDDEAERILQEHLNRLPEGNAQE